MKYICKHIGVRRITLKDDFYKEWCDFSRKRRKEDEPMPKFRTRPMFRSFLYHDTGDMSQKVLIITTAPSFADKYALDAPLRRVFDYLLDTGIFAEFYVMSLFPLRVPDPETAGLDMHALMKKYDPTGNYRRAHRREVVEIVQDEKCSTIIHWDRKYNKDARWLIPYIAEHGICAFRLDEDGRPLTFDPKVNNGNDLPFISKVIPVLKGEEYVFKYYKGSDDSYEDAQALRRHYENPNPYKRFYKFSRKV